MDASPEREALRPSADADRAAGDNPFAAQAKMLWHMDRLAAWHGGRDPFPVLIEINPTAHCNEACRWCISGNTHLTNPAMTPAERADRAREIEQNPALSDHPERKRGLVFDDLNRFLLEARAMGLKAITWSGGGEPTTYSRFPDAVVAAAAAGLEQGLMTNGLYPSAYVPVLGTHLRWLRVSLDTLDEAKYAFHKRTGGFRAVLRNIEQVVSYPVRVGINMNLAPWNVDELRAMAEWSRDVGADYFQVRPTLGLPFEMRDNEPYREQPRVDWLKSIKPLLQEVETIRTDTFRACVSWDKFKDLEDPRFGRSYTKCLQHHFVCVLNADGDLCVCMYHLGDPASATSTSSRSPTSGEGRSGGRSSTCARTSWTWRRARSVARGTRSTSSCTWSRTPIRPWISTSCDEPSRGLKRTQQEGHTTRGSDPFNQSQSRLALDAGPAATISNVPVRPTPRAAT
jgi:MoaA/NifB/PqqE/SkfB family radical SAM enzyme